MLTKGIASYGERCRRDGFEAEICGWERSGSAIYYLMGTYAHDTLAGDLLLTCISRERKGVLEAFKSPISFLMKWR